MAAITNQGLNKSLIHMRTLLTNVGVSTDQTAFSASDTDLSPNAGATDLIATASVTNVSNAVDDYTIAVNSGNFGGNTIYTIGAMNGSASSDNVSRSVRTNGIGVESVGDSFTIGFRLTVSDQSA
jgi:basic membrane lipoprotein Med (substrate-binding protein (PBP1-ABC) superfamily)